MCRTGLVWLAELDGRPLDFEYAAMNNQNFVMRDVQTGTWWQQVTGEALVGPLKGRHLEMYTWDEVNFGIWREEHPDGRVLRPDPRFAAIYPFKRYRDAEPERAAFYTTGLWYRPDPDVALEPRDLVVSVHVGDRVKAYPATLLAEQTPLQDRIGDTRIVVLLAEDGRSARAFERTVDGAEAEFYRLEDSETLTLMDAETGSHWDFTGKAIEGPLTGTSLPRVQTVLDYWFDWREHNPDAPVYMRSN